MESDDFAKKLTALKARRDALATELEDVRRQIKLAELERNESDDPTTSSREAALTIEEFCKANRIGRSLFFELQKTGRGPRVIKLGRRTIITPEAQTEWRRRMQAESAQAPAVPPVRLVEPRGG